MQIVERELVEMKIRLKVFSIFYFFEPRVVGKHNVKMLGYVGKAPRICFWRMKGTLKNLVDAKDVNVLIIENWISYFGINGSGNDFMDNL